MKIIIARPVNRVNSEVVFSPYQRALCGGSLAIPITSIDIPTANLSVTIPFFGTITFVEILFPLSTIKVFGFSTGSERLAGAGKPTINPSEIKNHAKRKFPTTPATNTDAWTTRFLDWKLSRETEVRPGAPLRSGLGSISAGFSPNIFTNPPNGNQLSVNGVPFQVKSFLIRGGKPRPNSSTRIPNFLATKKCPNSWTIISAQKIIIKMINDTIKLG